MKKSPTFKVNRFLAVFCCILILLNIFLLVDKYSYKPNNTNKHSDNRQIQLVKKIIADKYLEDIPSDEEYENGQIKGLVSALGDPYSEYLSAKEYEDFSNAINQRYEGIGIRFEKQGGGFVVLQVFENSPANRVSILKGDIITEVDGENVSPLAVDELANKIRGPENTSVKLKLLRAEEFVEVEVNREKIQIDLVTFAKRDKTGIITISSFGEKAPEELEKIAEEIKKDSQITNLIIDLRSNNGGLLGPAIDLTSYFLEPNSVVVKEKNKQTEKILKSKNKQSSLLNYPTKILVDGFTASSSEIMAGALRDNRKLQLIGQKTYGKGVVQQIFEAGNNDLIKLTVEEWLTPAGTKINKEGLTPDIVTEPKEDALEVALTK